MAVPEILDDRGAFSGPLSLSLGAGEEVELVANARILYVDEANGVLQLDNGRVRVPLRKGRLIRLPFIEQRLRLVNQTASAVAMTIIAGNVAIEDHSEDVEITPPNNTTTAQDIPVSAVAVEVLPALAGRKHATLRNIGAATVRLGDQANVAADRGYPMRAGETYTYDGEDALYAIREGADSLIAVIDHSRT